ncbi:putative disease resistance RPP13-like protein 1 [Phragmites australis]|uniref:putative disease resistance RPP13-like protein 1 n=1 Tax=Phragmites australis TaxID=29695 RepID=UPI002D78F5B4|nr:putative disease resistance RPP13-like protein 1 [Phragmites australis]
MVMITDAVITRYTNKLADLVEDRVMRALGVVEDLKMLRIRLDYMKSVLVDAEVKRIHDSAINSWLNQLKDVMYDADDLIDLCSIKSQRSSLGQSSSMLNQLVCHKVPLLSWLGDFQFNCKIGYKIKNINERLERILMDRIMLSLDRIVPEHTSVSSVNIRQTDALPDDVVGADIVNSTNEMVEKLTVYRDSNSKFSVFGIEGMPGIGKTTLAKKIYNDPRIEKGFQLRIWLCVTEIFDEINLLKQIIRAAGGNTGQQSTKAELVCYLVHCISGRSVFLVLDDVWRAEVWTDLLCRPFEHQLELSRILITTRHSTVLQETRAVHIHRVQTMNEETGLELLLKNIFRMQEMERVERFTDIGRQIILKCDGLPLAIKVIAGVLSSKSTIAEWEGIRDCEWSLDGLPDRVEGLLYLSYRDLPSELKQCYLFCSILPASSEIHRQGISYWWDAEGLVSRKGGLSMQDATEGCYDELVRRNLLQLHPRYLDKSRSTMHDLLRSLSQHLSKDDSMFIDSRKITDSMPRVRRLGIANVGERLPAELKNIACLRTLALFNSPKFSTMDGDFFRRLKHLRILFLSATSIRTIPKSVKKLVHLRVLDLSFTKIRELPKSIGHLLNLQYLSLLGCSQLYVLPNSLAKLSNLRFLRLNETKLTSMPRGIGRLQHLDELIGVFESPSGFRLDELQSLSHLRRLRIDKLERVEAAGVVLKDKTKLKELSLGCTIDRSRTEALHGTNEGQGNMTTVYENLVPPPNLSHFFIHGFLGTKFPKWLVSLSPDIFINLGHMHLNDCISCPQVPPAGHLPELLVLRIKGADAVVKLDTQLFGQGMRDGEQIIFFPKLELCQIFDMYNLMFWSLNTQELCSKMLVNPQQVILMPHLNRLMLINCPKLGSLPDGLSKITSLQRIQIEGADSLEEIANLPAVVWLKVRNNESLKRVSNLRSLERLLAQDCPALGLVQLPHSLQKVYLVDCPMEQDIRACLPQHSGILVHVATTGGDDRDMFTNESIYN